jgi:putative transposase
MKYDSNRHGRRSIRLNGYDYSRAGAYFVTVCTRDWACLFGEIADGQMLLNAAGLVVEQCWLAVPRHYPNVELDQFVVMPNHVHGIVAIVETVGATHASPPRRAGPKGRSIGAVVGSFKSAVTKRINELSNTSGTSVIVRDDASLDTMREYIVRNPLRWDYDRENPTRATHASPLQFDP